MSRIGKDPITVPAGVDVTVNAGTVSVKGPKGNLSFAVPGEITVRKDDANLLVERPNDERDNRALHGLTRTLVNNMVVGVTTGFTKELEIIGVGYRAAMKGKDLEVQAGYSHPVMVPVPEGIEFETPTPTQIVVRGNDKQAVGEIAAKIRKIRKPEPYKGKGVRYAGEVVRRKVGKTGK